MLVSQEFMEDPYPLLRQLRQEDPVHWSDSIGGWILTRFDDMMVTFKDTAHFSNEGAAGEGRCSTLPPGDPHKDLRSFEKINVIGQRSLIHSDPPDHTRLRSLVTKAFNARVVEGMRPRMQEIVNEAFDVALQAGGMDVIKDLGVPLPVTVLAEILGVPKADVHLFKGWADGLLAFQGLNKPSVEILQRAQDSILGIREYLGALLKEKKIHPGEDLLRRIGGGRRSEGERLSETKLLNTCITLLVAGHETTTSLIGNGIWALLQHPEQWQLLKDDPALLPSAIEEMLRFESPVARQPRLMKREAEMGGKQLRPGEMVFQMLNAANRDPEYFTEPDRFDIRRQKNKHIAFGFGPHFCVGALLARTEGQVVFSTLLARLPHARLVHEKPDWDIHKPNSRMLKTLPIST